MTSGSPALTNLSPEQRRELLRQLLERKTRQPRIHPLSLGQEALWFLDQLEPGRPTYGFYPAVRLRGALDLGALERSLAEVLRRHDALRTTFPEVDGLPVQRVAPFQSHQLPIIDLSGLPDEQREAEARRIVEGRPPMDLQEGPLVRAQVVRLDQEDHIVLVHIHHIIFDGWSLGVLTREILTLYSAFRVGRPSPLPDLTIQYADFAAWQRQYLQAERLEKLCDYWRKRLAGLAPLDLPTDYPRPAIRTSRGDTFQIKFAPELTRAVLEYSRQARVTPFMTLLAAFQEVLRRYSGQEDFTIGTPTANRRQKNLEPLIGYFINVLVLRADLSGSPTFRQLVQRVRETALSAYEHQELTLDKITEAVRPERDLSRHPLFQVMFVVQNNPRTQVNLPGLQVTPLGAIEPTRSAKFELTVALRMTPQGLAGRINFNTDLFASATIQRMIGHYQMILADVLAEPDRPLSVLPLVSDAEQRQVLVQGNYAAGVKPGQACIHELFEAQVERTPEAVAVIDGPRQLTYRELNERANQLAHVLQACGVGPDQPVGVRLHRSAELIISLLGVLKAGGAYVPLDPQLPADRLHYTLQDARVEVLITRRGLSGELPGGLNHVVDLDAEQTRLSSQPTANPPRRAAPGSLAYIIYTSGSTGRPKGVMIEHRALVNYTLAAVHEYGIRSSDRVLQFASVSYDAHVEEIYPCLTQGGVLVLRSEDALDSFQTFLQRCAEWQLSVLTVPTGFWHELTAAMDAQRLKLPKSLRLLIIGGEKARRECLATWFECVGQRVRLLNTYGPTETTVVSLSAELRRVDGAVERVPIGRPVANTRVYLLDAYQRLVPIGVPGELHIGGESVARGYLHREDLTAERFLPDPFSNQPNGRMYKTGDLVRWLSDGRLEFIGRTDYQVKIRGFRVEPEEVEQLLCEHPSIAGAAVLALERAPGDLHLVGYVAGRGVESPTHTELRRFLSARLPEHMVPSLFVTLDRLPATTSGKVDRRALPPADWSRSALQGEYVAPRTSTEIRLAAIWCEVLSVERVGLHDNFFELGGNSLLAIRLMSRVRSEFSVEVPLVTLFAAPTLAELAGRITQLRSEGRTSIGMPTLQRIPWEGPAPLSFAQEQFWTVIRMFPNLPMSNMHATVPIIGAIDTAILCDTFNEIVRRHENLRTTFTTRDDGTPVQLVADQMHVSLPVNDLRHLSKADQRTQVRELSREQKSHVFDLSQLPLFRIRLLRLGETEHVLVLTGNHIVFDGWSLAVLTREVSEIYEAFQIGRPSPLPELPIQYRDYANWEREYLRGPARESLLKFWQQKLEGVQSPDVPTDRPRHTHQPHVQRQHRFTVSNLLKGQVERLARAEGVTLFVVFLTSFKALLSRYCNAHDIAVAAPVANRKRPETQRLMGVFINTVILRTDVSGDPTFRELLARVRDTAYDAFEHEEMPLEQVADALQPQRDPTRFPLSQVMFNYLQPTSSERPRRQRELQLGWENIESDPISTRLDLVLTLTERAHGFRASLKYDAALFDGETVERIAEDFLTLLEAICATPDQRLSQLPLAEKLDQQRMLPGRNEIPTTRDLRSPELVRGRSLAPLRVADMGTPLFCIHGLGGHIATFLPLARQLRSVRPVYGLQALGLEPDQQPHERIEDMAAAYLAEMRAVQPRGPYLLVGWSLGGVIALEMSQQLAGVGQTVALLAMLDTYLSVTDRDLPDMNDASVLRWIGPHLQISASQLSNLAPPEQWALINERAQQAAGIGSDEIRRLATVCQVQLAAGARYRPQSYGGPVILFRAAEARGELGRQWQSLCPQLQVERVPGNHYGMLRHPHVDTLAQRLDNYLQTAEESRDARRTP